MSAGTRLKWFAPSTAQCPLNVKGDTALGELRVTGSQTLCIVSPPENALWADPEPAWGWLGCRVRQLEGENQMPKSAVGLAREVGSWGRIWGFFSQTAELQNWAALQRACNLEWEARSPSKSG